jgi:hypothetical protein
VGLERLLFPYHLPRSKMVKVYDHGIRLKYFVSVGSIKIEISLRPWVKHMKLVNI